MCHGSSDQTGLANNSHMKLWGSGQPRCTGGLIKLKCLLPHHLLTWSKKGSKLANKILGLRLLWACNSRKANYFPSCGSEDSQYQAASLLAAVDMSYAGPPLCTLVQRWKAFSVRCWLPLIRVCICLLWSRIHMTEKQLWQIRYWYTYTLHVHICNNIIIVCISYV